MNNGNRNKLAQPGFLVITLSNLLLFLGKDCLSSRQMMVWNELVEIQNYWLGGIGGPDLYALRLGELVSYLTFQHTSKICPEKIKPEVRREERCGILVQLNFLLHELAGTCDSVPTIRALVDYFRVPRKATRQSQVLRGEVRWTLVNIRANWRSPWYQARSRVEAILTEALGRSGWKIIKEVNVETGRERQTLVLADEPLFW